MYKKILCVLLTICLSVSIIPSVSLATDKGGATTEEVSEVVPEEDCTIQEADDLDEFTDMTLEMIEENSEAIITADAESEAFQTKRLIVVMKGESSLENTYGAKMAISDGYNKYILQYDTEVLAEEAYKKIKQKKNVASVSVEQIVSVLNDEIDEENPLLQSGRNRWGAEQIESNRMKEYLKEVDSQSEIIVAVVDTGVDMDHPFIKDRLLSNGYDFIDADNIPDDRHMHGTHCSGIIKDNTPDNVKILPVKAFNANGTSSELIIAAGINYAVQQGADIISMSFGSYHFNSTDCEICIAVKNAVQKGVVCVAAAGNDSSDCENTCPARIESCITVSAVNRDDTLCTFSNYGEAIDVAAPGQNIWSSALEGKYVSASGTSMATPYVSAAVAMLLLANPEMNREKVEEAIKDVTADRGEVGEDRSFGAGVLDFGVYFGDNEWATSIAVSEEKLTLYVSESVDFGATSVNVQLSPDTATHKAYTVEVADENIAQYDGFGFVAKGEGDTTAIFRTTSGESDKVQIVCEKRTFWIDDVADEFAGGMGTKYDPYLVETPQQLARIAYLGDNLMLSCDMYFKQIADIDLAGNTWYPIRAVDEGSNITRINYDGGGYNISNLQISNIEAGVYLDYAGLFAFTEGDLRNINMIDVDIDSPESAAAGICCDLGGYMENCYVDGKIIGMAAGGLVARLGDMQGLSINNAIVNCRSDAIVTGINYVGGLVWTMSEGRIENCIFTGETRLASPLNKTLSKGGIVGSMTPCDGIVSEKRFSYDNCKIINCVSVEDVVGNIELNIIEVSDVESYGQTQAENTTIPINETVTAEISNCYYSGEYESGIKNIEHSNRITNVEKVDGSLFREKEFYTDENRWSSEQYWDMEKVWKLGDEYPELIYKEKKTELSVFDYHEYGNSITITGYYGLNPHVVIPETIAGKPVTYIDFCFQSHNVDILSLYLPDNLKAISNKAFANIPENRHIGESLRYVDLGEGVKYIGRAAFSGCGKLQAITIPKSVEVLENFVFECTQLTAVFFEGNVKLFGEKAFYGGNGGLTITLYYRKDATGWGNYKPNQDNMKIIKKKYDTSTKPVAISFFSSDDGMFYLKKGETRQFQYIVFPEESSNKSIKYTTLNGYIEIDKSNVAKMKKKKYSWDHISINRGKKELCSIRAYTTSDKNNYTIRFDGNGATSGSMVPQSVNYHIGETLNKNQFVKVGYAFRGWSTKKNSRMIQLTDQEMAYKLAQEKQSVTLYAIWEKVDYNVRFEANGGSGNMEVMSIPYNVKKKLIKNQFVAPSGKVFAGWSRAKGETGVYADGAQVFNLLSKDGATVTLYAVWIKPKTYKIKYKLNGGKLASNTKKTYKAGKGYTLKKPKRKGYKFVGWYTDKKMKKGKITRIEAWQTGKVKLFAKWKKKK